MSGHSIVSATTRLPGTFASNRPVRPQKRSPPIDRDLVATNGTMSEELVQAITPELRGPRMRDVGRHREHEYRVYGRAGANLDCNGPTATETATDGGLVL